MPSGSSGLENALLPLDIHVAFEIFQIGQELKKLVNWATTGHTVGTGHSQTMPGSDFSTQLLTLLSHAYQWSPYRKLE